MTEACTKSIRIAESVRLLILEHKSYPKETYSEVIRRHLESSSPRYSVNNVGGNT